MDNTLKLIFQILLICASAAIIVITAFHEGKGQGISALSGMPVPETYYSKNSGRFSKGILKRLSIILIICFAGFSLLLSANLPENTKAGTKHTEKVYEKTEEK